MRANVNKLEYGELKFARFCDLSDKQREVDRFGEQPSVYQFQKDGPGLPLCTVGKDGFDYLVVDFVLYDIKGFQKAKIPGLKIGAINWL